MIFLLIRTRKKLLKSEHEASLFQTLSTTILKKKKSFVKVKLPIQFLSEKPHAFLFYVLVLPAQNEILNIDREITLFI